MTNTSTSDGTTWGYNLTALTESYYATTSFWNVTISVNEGGGNETNITYAFYVDTITPVVANYTDQPTIDNTTGGDSVFMSASVVENNTDSCWFLIYFKLNQQETFALETTLDGTLSSTSTRTPNCNITIEPGNFTKNGYYEIQAVVNDSAGQEGVSSQNETFIVDILQASQWNAIAMLEEDNGTRGGNFYQWADNHSYISYVSEFNSSAQGFITYTVGSASNNLTDIYFGMGAYVYPSSDSVLIRHNRTISSDYENVTFVNSSAYGPWTLAGMMYVDYNISSLSAATSYSNWASFHNNTDDYYYTYARNFGSSAPANYILQGKAVWIDSNATSDVLWSRRLNT
jgi:hypothetical protein